MDELITFLRNKTHLVRLTEPELREVIARMDDGGWEVVRKADGAIVEAEPEPVAEPIIEPMTLETEVAHD